MVGDGAHGVVGDAGRLGPVDPSGIGVQRVKTAVTTLDEILLVSSMREPEQQ